MDQWKIKGVQRDGASGSIFETGVVLYGNKVQRGLVTFTEACEAVSH